MRLLLLSTRSKNPDRDIKNKKVPMVPRIRLIMNSESIPIMPFSVIR